MFGFVKAGGTVEEINARIPADCCESSSAAVSSGSARPLAWHLFPVSVVNFFYINL